MDSEGTNPEIARIEPVEPALPAKPTLEQTAEVERLLQQASLARIRGQGSLSERLLREAAEAAPGSAAVQAALGDEFWGRGHYAKARECYKAAHRIEPDSVLFETKWAESIVGSLGDPLALTASLAESYASAKSAGCLSMLLPGLGQIVLGDTGKGAWLIAVYVAAWVWAIFTPNGLSGIPTLLGYGGQVQVKSFNPVVLVPLSIAIATWIGSLMLISSRAKSLSPKSIQRPEPPGSGKFEI